MAPDNRLTTIETSQIISLLDKLVIPGRLSWKHCIKASCISLLVPLRLTTRFAERLLPKILVLAVHS